MSDELRKMACNEYNIMVTTKKWFKSEPKYALIAALTTRVNHLEGRKSCGGSGNQTKNYSTTWSYGIGEKGDAP